MYISEILKQKPVGTTFFYEPYGTVSYQGVTDRNDEIAFSDINGLRNTFIPDSNCNYGLYELGLFPSYAMRDWDKFSWQKYDWLTDGKGCFCSFMGWQAEDYTRFDGCLIGECGSPEFNTSDFSIYRKHLPYLKEGDYVAIYSKQNLLPMTALRFKRYVVNTADKEKPCLDIVPDGMYFCLENEFYLDYSSPVFISDDCFVQLLSSKDIDLFLNLEAKERQKQNSK